MSDILQEVKAIPICPKCNAKHHPHEACRASTEETMPLCSLCVGNHRTLECPVLTPEMAWEQPVLPTPPVVAGRFGQRGDGRRRRRRNRRR